jgi:hypothetical protein
MENYRCEATTLEGFVQQLAVGYVSRGYWFYVTGFIPAGKDPYAVDEKLVSRYGLAISKWARARRKQTGAASVQYLRFRRYFVLIATHGRHRFFDEEGTNVRDVRRSPIRAGGYSVGYRGGRPHVRIDREEYLRIKSYFTEVAQRRSAERIRAELAALPFEPYAPIRSQYCVILRLVNRLRQQAGLPLVSTSSLRFKRRIYRPFEPVKEPVWESEERLFERHLGVEEITGLPPKHSEEGR